MHTTFQHKGDVVRRAKANLRWQRARDICDAGGTFEDAVAATGMKPSGLRNLLFTRTGSRTWPIALASAALKARAEGE